MEDIIEINGIKYRKVEEKNIKWLSDNIPQFDRKVLDDIIEKSILPDNPKK